MTRKRQLRRILRVRVTIPHMKELEAIARLEGDSLASTVRDLIELGQIKRAELAAAARAGAELETTLARAA